MAQVLLDLSAMKNPSPSHVSRITLDPYAAETAAWNRVLKLLQVKGAITERDIEAELTGNLRSTGAQLLDAIRNYGTARVGVAVHELG